MIPRNADARMGDAGDKATNRIVHQHHTPREVETSYGGGELERYAEEIGVEYNSLQEYRRVAAAYELSTRVDNLTFSHHRDIASRPDRLDWLALAADAVDAGQARGEIADKGRLANPRVSGIKTTTLADIGVSSQRLDEARKLRDHYTDAGGAP